MEPNMIPYMINKMLVERQFALLSVGEIYEKIITKLKKLDIIDDTSDARIAYNEITTIVSNAITTIIRMFNDSSLEIEEINIANIAERLRTLEMSYESKIEDNCPLEQINCCRIYHPYADNIQQKSMMMQDHIDYDYNGYFMVYGLFTIHYDGHVRRIYQTADVTRKASFGLYIHYEPHYGIDMRHMQVYCTCDYCPLTFINLDYEIKPFAYNKCGLICCANKIYTKLDALKDAGKSPSKAAIAYACDNAEILFWFIVNYKYKFASHVETYGNESYSYINTAIDNYCYEHWGRLKIELHDEGRCVLCKEFTDDGILERMQTKYKFIHKEAKDIINNYKKIISDRRRVIVKQTLLEGVAQRDNPLSFACEDIIKLIADNYVCGIEYISNHDEDYDD